jgi:hypothetical protein
MAPATTSRTDRPSPDTDKPQNRQRPTAHGQFIADQNETINSQPNDHSKLRRWIEAEVISTSRA